MVASLVNIVMIVLTTILGCALGVIILAPTQFEPYVTDKRESEKSKLVSPSPASYGSDHNSAPKREQAEDKGFTSSVQVLVLGDIGRSPRMQYHAISLAERGAYVNVIGYTDSPIHNSISTHPRIQITSLPKPPAILQTKSRIWFTILGPLKVVWQILSLAYILGYGMRATKWMLVQNPPSIPVLMIARAISWLRNTRLVIDWHNFGWSILALRLGNGNALVRASEWYEKFFAGTADRHFAVTKAMARYLQSEMAVQALALHDRPAKDFQPLSSSQRESVLARLEPTKAYAKEIEHGNTRLLVSSTSWTPDEDFSLLLSSLTSYSCFTSSTQSPLPKLLVVITGKGPQQEHYLEQIKALESQNRLANVTIKTAFLSFPDYAALLGAADLGVCLHTSSSGLDLPMKVVDMFGAGLPVVGWSDYESWPELVIEGVNGRGFKSSEELSSLLRELLPSDASLETLQKGAIIESQRRWDEEWNGVAGDLIFFPEKAKKK